MRPRLSRGHRDRRPSRRIGADRGVSGRAIVGILAAIGIVGGWLLLGGRDSGMGQDVGANVRCQVERGDLIVTLLQAGELVAQKSNSIVNDTESSAKIIEVVEDGARVKKGDLLLELEATDLRDRVLNQQSSVANAEADYERAGEQLKIKELKYKTDLEGAELAVEIAILELKKYEEAEFPQQVRKAEMNITLAEEELSIVETKLETTRALVEKEFTSRQELQTVTLEKKRKEIDLLNKQEDLRILQDYTHTKQQKLRTNDVSQTGASLERLMKTYTTERRSTLVNLDSKKRNLGIAKNKLTRLEKRLEKTKVYSEYDGQVFYPPPGWRDDRTIEKGATLHPRQKVLEFPYLSAREIKVGVPESVIKKIVVGQRAVATIDAIPGEVIHAVVERIGIVPDRTSRWSVANSKTYTVTLDVPETPDLDLKPGMSATVEIIVKILPDVLHLPIQAVRSEGEAHYVYLAQGNKVRRTPVEVGDHNDDRIAVLAGLELGDEVLLYAPVQADTSASLRDRPLAQAGGAVALPQAKTGAAGAAKQDQPEGRPKPPAAPEGGTSPPRASPPSPAEGETPAGFQPGQRPSQEQMQKWREDLEKMTPEEREKMREQWQGRRGGGGGGRGGRGGRPRPDRAAGDDPQ